MRRLTNPMIVFGAGDRPTKTVIGGEYKRIRGTAVVAICEINNDDGKYDWGDKVAKDDIGGMYTSILFCNKGALDGFIKDLTDLKKAMEGKWRK